MLYLQKGNFQKVVRSIGGNWMSATQATFFGIIFIFLTAASYYLGLTYESWRWLLLLVPVFLFLRLAMNTLDGMLSRECGTATAAGELWNEALDVFGDTICYGSPLLIPAVPYKPLVLFIILLWAAEFFGVLGKSMPGGTRRHETIGGGKPDRAVWMGLSAVILFLFPSFMNYFAYYLYFVSILVGLTVIIRIRKTIQAAKGKEYKSYTWIGR
jgi:CDP-diacylglycerol--glycerol-3-phosphate 3-phosphatidyltransferase